MLRTGQQYLDDVKGRKPEVYMGGERIKDVTTHPAFRNIINTTAQLYDVTSDPARANELSYVEIETGERCSNNYLMPRTREDLLARGRAHQAWSDVSWGLYGRSPDHVAGWITGMACVPEVARANSHDFEAHVVDYYRRVRNKDLFVTYAIVPPAATRSVDSVFTAEKNTALDPKLSGESGLQTIGDDDTGITVWGFKILATAAILADEILVGNFQVLAPGMEQFAATFTVPTDAPGIKLISRRSYEQQAPSELDDPLAWRFDETDCVVFFDNVHIPWENVFAYKNLESSRGLFHETPAHVLGNYQAHVRLLSKLRFILGVTRKVTEMNGIAQIPAVRDMLADLCIKVAMLEALLSAETDITEKWPNGFIGPDRQTMYATMDWTMRDYPNFIQVVRELLGSHPFQQPADVSVFDNPETRKMYSKFVMAEPEDAVGRYKLMRLIWDLVGSEFASRHIQYEMFYNGPRHVGRTRASHYFRWDVVEEAAQRALDDLGGYEELVEKRIRGQARESF
jgi:4-hydroxyphenylacetate 3-monooxygenase